MSLNKIKKERCFMIKRILNVLLCSVMALGLLSTAASAADCSGKLKVTLNKPSD